MLNVTINFAGRHATAFCSGRLVFGEEDTLLKAIFVIRACDCLTLDLAEVDAVDARGLGILGTIAKWARREKVDFAIANPTRKVFDLIHLVRLDTVFRVLIIEQPQFISCMDQKLAERMAESQAHLMRGHSSHLEAAS
jgi:anti-anti-sigma regulatory factor